MAKMYTVVCVWKPQRKGVLSSHIASQPHEEQSGAKTQCLCAHFAKSRHGQKEASFTGVDCQCLEITFSHPFLNSILAHSHSHSLSILTRTLILPF